MLLNEKPGRNTEEGIHQSSKFYKEADQTKNAQHTWNKLFGKAADQNAKERKGKVMQNSKFDYRRGNVI